MNQRGLLGVVAAGACVAACAGQAVVSQYRVAPGSDVELSVVYRPKPGTKFSDFAEKTLNVSVAVAGRSSSQPAIYLFAREYSLRATDIDWTILWESADRGRVEFVSYPAGQGKYDIPEAERASLDKPIGRVVVARRNADTFEAVSEQWSVPYSAKDYPRGVAR